MLAKKFALIFANCKNNNLRMGKIKIYLEHKQTELICFC